MAATKIECPACAANVTVTNGQLADHDRTPDDGAPEHCRWSGEPTDLVVA